MAQNSLEDVQQSFLEKMPAICRPCPELGACALMYAMLSTSEKLTGAHRVAIEQEIRTRTGDTSCPDGPANGECRSVKLPKLTK